MIDRKKYGVLEALSNSSVTVKTVLDFFTPVTTDGITKKNENYDDRY